MTDTDLKPKTRTKPKVERPKMNTSKNLSLLA
jgi:hypothetical protein